MSGSDFDQCVTHVLEQKLGERIVALEAAEEAVSCDFSAPTCALHNLYQLSESVRRLLTDGQDATTECMMIPGKYQQSRNLRSQDAMEIGAAEHVSGPSGEAAGGINCGVWEPFSLELTRSEYELQCATLFDRGVDPVTRLLDRLDLSVDDIDEVVMVGGMTRTPRVRQLLQTHLGVDRLNVEIDPDIVVAYGAATIAH